MPCKSRNQGKERLRDAFLKYWNWSDCPIRERIFPSQLSGGEQQRVAIARALVNRPAILVADEPTGNLDPQNSDELMEVLIRINDQGTTVVMATHAKDIVNAMKKRVIMLDHGKVVYDEKEGGYHEAPLL